MTEHRHFLSAGGMVFALYVSRTGNLNGQPAQAVRYFHQDHLGSTSAVTDDTGAVVERMAYDPWGKRRNTNGVADPMGLLVGATTDRGYALHEHLDEVGAINMNGRLFDPLIGRFMSADPFIQDPMDLQSYNRYAYVRNNPMLYTDPSGYFRLSLGGIFRTAIAVGVAYASGGTIQPWLVAGGVNATAAGMAAAAVNGFAIGTVVSGGSFKAGAISALSAAAFNVVGGWSATADGFSNVAAHAAVGCGLGAATGGDCKSGAIGAAAGSAFTQLHIQLDGVAANIALQSIAGGTASVLAGGKFGMGAYSSALGYLFNYCAHNGNCTSKLEQALYDWWPGYKAGTLLYNQTMGDGSWTGWEVVDALSVGTGAGGKGLQLLGTVGREIQLAAGFYQAEGSAFKFSKYYYEKLWDTGRGAPFLQAQEVLSTATNVTVDRMAGFYRYTNSAMEMVYNPTTKEVWHLMPLKK